LTTHRLYLEDAYLAEFAARVEAADAGGLALSATAFYPGGGGQPPDTGTLEIGGATYRVTEVRPDDEGTIWHVVERTGGASCPADGPPADLLPHPVDLPRHVGSTAAGRIDRSRRYDFMRHHTLLHIVNALVLADYGGPITGVQIGEEKSRIDFRIEGFDPQRVVELETRINDIITRDLAVDSYVMDEAEFRTRPELVRTAVVAPPVVDGRVRVVSIEGFDAQACGGTHVSSTGEIGGCTVLRTENKGRNNKRLYLALRPAETGTGAVVV